MKKHKFAIIGLGFISPKHIEAIREVGGEIVDVCDINIEKALNKQLHHEVKVYADYKTMLDETTADFISICTPNYLHPEMIFECAKRNKTILCEKPMTFKLENIEKLKTIPKLYGMFQLRYLPEIGQIRKLSRSSKKVEMVVEMKRSHTYYETWKGDDTKTGGLLMNIGCHYFDLIGHLFGYEGFDSVSHIEDTCAEGTISYPDTEVKWKISFTEEQPTYERSLTVQGVKFDLVQQSNLHVRAYQDLMWCHGITAKEEEKIIKMISKI